MLFHVHRIIPICIFVAAGAQGTPPAETPQAGLTNGLLEAKLYLPDPVRGYYRGTRFDWSGVISSLKYAGHEYFGQWFEKYDPKIHDAITGPVEEFRTREAGLGYEDAKPGGTFIRIGVGVVRKPEEPRYQTFRTYEIVDSGVWKIRRGKEWIEFTHKLADSSDYAYVYRKTVRLAHSKPVMTIEHALRNTGRRRIETVQYNHNFFVIDGQPTGPGFTVTFPFALRPLNDLKGLAETRGRELHFPKELEKGQSIYTVIEGYGKEARDYDIRIENKVTGAGVRITGDRPLAKLVFWSVRSTLCPEPYVDLQVEPGREIRWRLTYEFYTLPKR